MFVCVLVSIVRPFPEQMKTWMFVYEIRFDVLKMQYHIKSQTGNGCSTLALPPKYTNALNCTNWFHKHTQSIILRIKFKSLFKSKNVFSLCFMDFWELFELFLVFLLGGKTSTLVKRFLPTDFEIEKDPNMADFSRLSQLFHMGYFSPTFWCTEKQKLQRIAQ